MIYCLNRVSLRKSCRKTHGRRFLLLVDISTSKAGQKRLLIRSYPTNKMRLIQICIVAIATKAPKQAEILSHPTTKGISRSLSLPLVGVVQLATVNPFPY